MKGKSLFWMYLLFLIVILIDLATFGVRYYSPFEEFVFYATIIVAAFSFLLYSINFNISAFFLLNAFFLNLFFITLEIVNGQRSMLIALSCILSLIGVISCILKIGPESKKRVYFPEPASGKSKSEPSDKAKRQIQSKKDAIEKEIGVSSLKKPTIEPYHDLDEDIEDIENFNLTNEEVKHDFKHSQTENKTVRTLLKEIEEKAEELNQEIRGIVSKKHKPLARESGDVEKTSDSEREKDNVKAGKVKEQKASYVAGRNSEYYHSLDCPVAKRLMKKRFYDSKEKAEAAGLKPHFCVR